MHGIALLAAPNRPILLGAAALCLLSGAVLLWRQRKAVAVCSPSSICSRPAVRGITAVGLLLGLVLLYLGYAYA